MIVCAGGAIWLNPFATVLFNVCSAVTINCCVLYPCCVGVFGIFAVMKRIRLFPSVFVLLRGVIWACMGCPCQYFCSILE